MRYYSTIAELILITSFFWVAVALPSNDYVGIENGRRVVIQDVPYQVSIRFYGEHQCGGIIISNRFILTGALCLPLSDNTYSRMTVVAGTATLNNGGKPYNILGGVKHERFNIESLDYDIGLLKLSEPLEMSRKVAVATLAELEPIFVAGTTFNVTGWGWHSIRSTRVSNFLELATVSWLDQNSCQDYYGGVATLNCRQFCSHKSSGPCPFDYGGPVTQNGMVIGIISGATRDCDWYPAVYTKVSAYRDWIQENMKLL